MIIINCAQCGTTLKMTKGNAYDKIKAHQKVCRGRLNLTKTIGLYLSTKASKYE